MSVFVDLLLEYGWLFIFFLSVAEEIITPLPSTLVIMIAGSLSPSAAMVPVYVGLPSALGSTIGSLFLFYIGKTLGRKGLEAIGMKEEMELLERAFRKRSGPLGMILLRAIPIIPFSVISGLAGISNYPLPQYLLFTFIGAWIRNSMTAYMGYFFSEAAETLSKYFSMVNAALLAIGIFAALLYWRNKKKIMKSISRYLA